MYLFLLAAFPFLFSTDPPPFPLLPERDLPRRWVRTL
jgi:hypothetical protein